MQIALHKAHTRGHTNHGWLDAYHSFSFGGYHHPERINFGMLRVLNDDTLAPARGFAEHPHHNMEIITIPLEGDLEHKDSIGNSATIQAGDVQVMSAGTGILHSEYNKNKNKSLRLLQIWVFPNKEQVAPRYHQISTRDIEKPNQFYQILSPHQHDQGVWIYQDAWFSLGIFDAGQKTSYNMHKPQNGIYLFVIEGSAIVNKDIALSHRDGLGIWDTPGIELTFHADRSSILLMEVPMQ